MFDNEIAKYKSLNHLAESDGIVIFGGNDDVDIPLGELKQAFAINERIYNRSFSSITVAGAATVYTECIAELCPDTVLLHIGEADVSDFNGNEIAFETSYRTLIDTVREKNKGCRIVIISLKNYDNNVAVTEINKLLKAVADSEKCEFEDISAKQAWNAKESSGITAFLYDIGFDRPLNVKHPIYNLVRILFCY
ncbi:MAG: SGNH/GDSL hydrolase family protein [Clostridia bacterium]|nr:SGNH/GDSL hydrolase family protein [Clostridia bacterium]